MTENNFKDLKFDLVTQDSQFESSELVSFSISYKHYGSKTSGEVTESYQMQKHSIVCVLFVQD